MIQKIIRVGNSAALTIPKQFLKQTGLEVGDEMAIETNNNLKMIIAKPKKEANKTTITPEFEEWINSFLKKYSSTLKALARV